MSYRVSDPAYAVTVSRDGSTVAVATPGLTGPQGPAGGGGGGGGGLKAYVSTGRVKLTPFGATSGAGAWTLYPASLRVTIPAGSVAAGDLVVVYPAIISTSGDAEGDLAAVVAGVPVRFLSSGTGTQDPVGHGGLYLSGNYGQANYPAVAWHVQSGDLDAGALTLSLMYRAGAARQIGHAGYASQVDAVNHGQV